MCNQWKNFESIWINIDDIINKRIPHTLSLSKKRSHYSASINQLKDTLKVYNNYYTKLKN
jgi:hypothetical protein